MEHKQEETNEATAAKKMLESNEVISKEDAEIRRLIEERRTTPKEEKQRLKEVSKQKTNESGTKKVRKDRKRFNEYSKTSKGSPS